MLDLREVAKERQGQSPLNVHLAEYQALRNEIVARIGFGSNIINYGVLLFGALATALKFFYDQAEFPLAVAVGGVGAPAMPQRSSNDLQWLLLFVPPLFLLLFLPFLHNTLMIQRLSSYIRGPLSASVRPLVGAGEGAGVWAWETAMEYDRRADRLRPLVLIVAMDILFVVFALLPLILFFRMTPNVPLDFIAEQMELEQGAAGERSAAIGQIILILVDLVILVASPYFSLEAFYGPNGKPTLAEEWRMLRAWLGKKKVKALNLLWTCAWPK